MPDIEITQADIDIANKAIETSVLNDSSPGYAVLSAALARQAALTTITTLQARLEEAERALEIAQAPKCFSCGAKVTWNCPRAADVPCGREHFGGSRKALEGQSTALTSIRTDTTEETK